MPNSASRFKDRVAIVTGAASGIGLATAKAFARQGATVVLADLHADKLDTARRELEKSGAHKLWDVSCDVGKEEQVGAAVDGTMSRFGHLDIIVNCAGVMVFKPIVESTEDDWLRILRVDLLGAMFFIKHGFRCMKAGSAIVNVSSVHAVETTPLVSSYAAAKAALLSLTRSASLEGKAQGIRVNAVLPGAIDTPMLWDNPNIKAGLETVGKSDVGKPEDVADTILYLASKEASFIQGADVRCDGGRLTHL